LKNGKSQAPLHPKLIKTGWFHAWNKPYETQCSASVVNGRLELTNKSTKVLQLLAFPSLAVGYGHRVLCPCHFGLAHNHWPQIGLVQISWTISLYIYTVHIYIYTLQCYGQCLGCNDCPTNHLWFLHCLGSASVQIDIQQRENHLLAKFSWSPKPWSSKMIHLGHQMGDNYLKLRCLCLFFWCEPEWSSISMWWLWGFHIQ
jgi:hypothetical protein